MENTHSGYSTIGSVAGLIARALHTYGCDPEPLFSEAGIDITEIARPAARFPVSRMQRLWQLAVEQTGDDTGSLSPTQLQGCLGSHCSRVSF